MILHDGRSSHLSRALLMSSHSEGPVSQSVSQSVSQLCSLRQFDHCWPSPTQGAAKIISFLSEKKRLSIVFCSKLDHNMTSNLF